MNNNCGIYMIKNLVNNKVYIGQSINIKKRFREHKYNLKNNIHANHHLQNAWNKYGGENFEFIVLEYCTENLINNKEEYYISVYKTIDSKYGYNKKEGGKNGRLSEETKNKMSISQMGKKHSEETKLIIKEKNLGKKYSEETKNKMSESKIGKHYHTEESKKSISEKNKNNNYNLGKKRDKTFSDKMRILNTGKKYSEETRRNLSLSHMKFDIETVHLIRKEINNGASIKDLVLKYHVCDETLRKIKKYIKPYNFN